MSKVHTNHRAASVPSLPRISSRPILATLLAVLAGCHRAPRGASSSAELEGVIGDSSAFGARITHLDRLRKRAFVTLTSPAYVVLLSVSPGRSIDPLWVDSAQTPALTGAASQMIAWRDPADTVGAGGRNEASPPVVPLPVQAEIDRCVRERTAAVERARARPRTRPRPVVRDSSGRAVPQPVEPRVSRRALTTRERTARSKPTAESSSGRGQGARRPTHTIATSCSSHRAPR